MFSVFFGLAEATTGCFSSAPWFRLLGTLRAGPALAGDGEGFTGELRFEAGFAAAVALKADTGLEASFF